MAIFVQQITQLQTTTTEIFAMELQLIQQKIYEIRGQRVMIDRDLAKEAIH